MEQLAHTINNANSINLLSFEVLHNFQELVVDTRPITEFKFHLIKVEFSIFHFEFEWIRGCSCW